MRKFILSIAFFSFVLFGAFSVQNLIANNFQVEFVKFDKDPKKDGDKKATDNKDVKTEKATTNTAAPAAAPAAATTDSKSCCPHSTSSCCGDKHGDPNCAKDKKEDCSKTCPDHK